MTPSDILTSKYHKCTGFQEYLEATITFSLFCLFDCKFVDPVVCSSFFSKAKFVGPKKSGASQRFWAQFVLVWPLALIEISLNAMLDVFWCGWISVLVFAVRWKRFVGILYCSILNATNGNYSEGKVYYFRVLSLWGNSCEFLKFLWTGHSLGIYFRIFFALFSLVAIWSPQYNLPFQKKVVITYTKRKVLNAAQKHAELMFLNCLEFPNRNFRFKFRIFKSEVLFYILCFSMFMKNLLNRSR